MDHFVVAKKIHNVLESIVLQEIFFFEEKVWSKGPQQKKGNVMVIGKIGDRSMKNDKEIMDGPLLSEFGSPLMVEGPVQLTVTLYLKGS